MSLWQVFFFVRPSYSQTLTYTSAHSLLWMHTLLWAPPKNRVGPSNLEIDEGTTSALLSTGLPPTTERIMPLNPRINPGKCEHPCQVGELNPGGLVPQQGTQPAKLRSVRSLWQLTFTGLLSFMCSTYMIFFYELFIYWIESSWIH
jgi:hypothetical protein